MERAVEVCPEQDGSGHVVFPQKSLVVPPSTSQHPKGFMGGQAAKEKGKRESIQKPNLLQQTSKGHCSAETYSDPRLIIRKQTVLYC